jgi:hypothetical protein
MHDRIPAETSPPPKKPTSLEITPDEFDYYLRQAQQMRADTMAVTLARWFAAALRMIARPIAIAFSALRPRGQVRSSKRLPSRAA